MSKKICIIYSYPSNSTHGPQILKTVISTLEQDGVGYELIDLYSQNFNPVMSASEAKNWGKDLSKQVLNYQQTLQSCSSWVFLYPSWWSSPPAILKGFIDRVFTPGFSHQIKSDSITPLLQKHRALILRTFSYSASQEQSGSSINSFIHDAVFKICGVQSDELDIYSIDSLANSAFEHTLKYVPGAVRRTLLPPTKIPHHLRSIPAPYLPPVEDKLDEIKAMHSEKEKKLSKSALADLNYFRTARKKARQSVYKRSDRAYSTRYRFDDDSDFHPKGYRYTSRRSASSQKGSKKRSNSSTNKGSGSHHSSKRANKAKRHYGKSKKSR